MWERLVIGIAAPVIAAAIVGVYVTMQDLSKAQAVTQAQLAEVQLRLSGIYTEAQATARHEEIFRTNQHQYELIEDHETRLRKIEALR